MGSGLFQPPPGPGTPLDTIPVADFVSTGQQLTQGAKKEGFWEHCWRVFWAAAADGPALVWGVFAQVIQTWAAFVVRIFTSLQVPNTAGFMDLVAAVIDDLLQTDISPQALLNTFRAGGARGALQAVGGAFYDNLRGILQAGGSAPPWTATDVPARQFMGFLIEFAIRSANADVITTLVPESFRIGEGFAAYGEKMERTLSLGRLARQAFMPLIKVMVADPLTRQLNSAYTPKQLSEAQYVKAFVRGDIDAATLQQNLAELGYPQNWQAALIAENTKAAGLHEVVNYTRATAPGSGVPTGALQVDGYSPTNAQVVWTAAMEALIDPLRKQDLAVITHQLRSGEIDLQTAQTILGTFSLFPQEAAYYNQIWQQILSFPRRRLSEGQMEKAFLDGVIDMTAMQTYWASVGYSLQDQQTLNLMLLVKLQGSTKTRAGAVGRKLLTEAEIEKAFKAGIITIAQAQAYWTAHGYPAVDIAILTQLLEAATGQAPQPVSGQPT